jgi:hypothetical protein
MRARKKHWIRLCGLAVTLTAMVLAGTISGSCVFDTRTTLCERFDLRCEEGQQCALDEAVCIPIGGCGDGIVGQGEVCDDGNLSDGAMVGDKYVLDKCSHDCKSDQTCGNGIPDMGEECDDGTHNGDPDYVCTTECTKRLKFCGNGSVEENEQCDPGEADSATCNSKKADRLACHVPVCGDGYFNMAAKACESSAPTPDCDGPPACTIPSCGDHFQNAMAQEDCDNGPGDTAGCNGNAAGSASCRFPVCGDNHTNTQAHEDCDRGSDDSPGSAGGPACNGARAGAIGCHFAACGDGYVNQQAGEDCDQAGGADVPPVGDKRACNGSAAGPAGCHFSQCGDRYANAADHEGCDNGSADSHDCNGAAAGSASCQTPACGDGHFNAMAEQCDNGSDDSPGCNGTGAGSVSCHNSVCGDHYTNRAAFEDCDTGGADTADCNGNHGVNGQAECRFPRCGDGYVNTQFNPPGSGSAEECDPGRIETGACPKASDGTAQRCNDMCQCVKISTSLGGGPLVDERSDRDRPATRP